MQVKVNEKSKILEIWMSGADQRDESCIAQAKALVSQWHSRGWTPVIYKSGKEDLAELTSALLVTNRDRAARREVEQARMAKAEPKPSVIEKLRRKPEPVKKASGLKNEDLSL